MGRSKKSFKKIISDFTNGVPDFPTGIAFSHLSRIQREMVSGDEYNLFIEPFMYSHSQMLHNIPKNRYSNIFPFDYNRVRLGRQNIPKPPLKFPIHFGQIDYKPFDILPTEKLTKEELGIVEELIESTPTTPGDEFINASWILPPSDISEQAFIATQGPKKGTVGDFWQMIYENKSPFIIMLAKLVEGYKPKCHQYWPTEENPVINAKGLTVRYLEESDLFYGSAVFRTFMIVPEKQSNSTDSSANPTKPHIVRQIQYFNWPDSSTPRNDRDIIEIANFVNKFISLLKEKNQLSNSTTLGDDNISINPAHPIVVHCSAGVGRTGTFIVLYTILDYFKNSNDDYPGDLIMDLTFFFRLQRIYMVQTIRQYEFLYFLFSTYFENLSKNN
ncbi:hypothetical protein BB560_005798 [Smittium megazygosporum]|uniref:Protein-tyrosine-phosphatase n=1 Tax=Smittium megazygosporum TaxID=133381 RepID=A0A2T9YW54_9FUNG|nr:hypothetical protein BB560_005798 [Smittium megazygosporum]